MSHTGTVLSHLHRKGKGKSHECRASIKKENRKHRDPKGRVRCVTWCHSTKTSSRVKHLGSTFFLKTRRSKAREILPRPCLALRLLKEWLCSKIYILLLHYLREFWACIQATIFQSPKAKLLFLGIDRNNSMNCLAWFVFSSS